MIRKKVSINYKSFYQFCFVLLFFLVSTINAYSQQIIKGKVLDDETDLPLAGISVFINSSTRGTMTNEKGEFSLNYLSINNYTVAFSSIGYEMQKVNVSIQPDKPIWISVKLKRRTISLNEVTISLQDNSWKRWGRTFLAGLLSTSQNAQSCNLLNKQAVKFTYDKKSNILFASNTEPLVVANDRLGYTIYYDIENFKIDFEKELISYDGFARFTEIDGTPAKRKRWAIARHETYKYSMSKFVRALYSEKQIDSLYEIRSLQKLPNTEKIRVIGLLKKNQTYRKDSMTCYQNIIKQADSIKTFSSPLHLEDLIVVDHNGRKSITGIEHLYISLIAFKNNVINKLATSELVILPSRHIYIEPTGKLTASKDFVINGYWSDSERLSDALPIDFIIQQK